MFEDFKAEWIRELNIIGKQMRVCCKALPTLENLLSVQSELNKILPDSGQADLSFTLNVFIAAKYAQTRFHYTSGASLLDDIKAGKYIYMKDYIAIRPKSDEV